MDKSSIPAEISNIREDIKELKRDEDRLRTQVYDLTATVIELSSVVKVYVESSNSIQAAVFDIKENIFQMNNPKKEEIENEILLKQLSDKVDKLEEFRVDSEREFSRMNNNRSILNYMANHPWIIVVAAAVCLSAFLSLDVFGFLKR